MPGLCLFDHVHRKHAKGIDTKLIQALPLIGHAHILRLDRVKSMAGLEKPLGSRQCSTSTEEKQPRQRPSSGRPGKRFGRDFNECLTLIILIKTLIINI
jgi:hypothetical protein